MNQIGYACQLVGPPRAALRSLILARATPDALREVAAHNLAVLAGMIDYNAANGIRLFRISSDIIPLATHPDARIPWRRLFSQELAELGRRIAASGQRVSMHPGQYTVLNSPDEGVAERATADLRYHADFLDALGVPASGKIVLHVGGVYKDRGAALERFALRFADLPSKVRRRLVLENDERSFAIDEVCALAGRVGVPVIMDVFHHQLLPPGSGDTAEWLRRAGATWRAEDGRQKIHYSQQLPGGRPGRHSRTVAAEDFVRFYDGVRDLPLDIMLEVKDKNLSALKCLDCVRENLPRAALTEAWARYKYAVLEHGPRTYNRIRQHLKEGRPAALPFYGLIESALAQEPQTGHAATAAEHVWGYFSKTADATAKRRFSRLLAGYREGTSSLASLKNFLFRMAEKDRQEYLLNSLYFDL